MISINSSDLWVITLLFPTSPLYTSPSVQCIGPSHASDKDNDRKLIDGHYTK